MNPHAESSETDLWSRLRESMERLSAQSRQQQDAVALAKRLKSRAHQLRGRMHSDQATGSVLTFLAFHKGNQRYGIAVRDVIEVQALDQFSSVPGTPPFIAGVVHWRGQVLSLLDLGKLLGIPETGLADIHVSLIVEAAGFRVAVLALEIEELYSVPQTDIKPAPTLPASIPPEWIWGVHDANRLILRMDRLLEDARLLNWRG